MKDKAIEYFVSPERMEKYKVVFPNIYNDVCEAAKHIFQDADSLKYLEKLRQSIYGEVPEGLTIEPEEGNITENFAPIFALLSYLDECEEEMDRRGFDSDTRKNVYQKFENILVSHKASKGFYGCSKMIFFWAKHYIKPDIIKIDNLEFEITKHCCDDIFRDTDGNLIPLREFTVDGCNVTGISVLRGGADGGKISFTGEMALAKGDAVISVHIPSKADISEKSCAVYYKHALEFFAKHYPEYKVKAFICHSWLMDPQLSTILKPGSNILTFQNFFAPTTHTRSSGEEVMTFVFGKRPDNLEDLPDNTTLTKNLKKRYLENNPIYAHIGIHFLER